MDFLSGTGYGECSDGVEEFELVGIDFQHALQVQFIDFDRRCERAIEQLVLDRKRTADGQIARQNVGEGHWRIRNRQTVVASISAG